MQKNLEIKVYGATASGKTVISRLIYETLKQHGFDVTAECQDGDMYKRTDEQQQQALQAVKQKGCIRVTDSHNATYRTGPVA